MIPGSFFRPHRLSQVFRCTCAALARTTSLTVAIGIGGCAAFAQVQLSTSAPYTQDFNAMGTAATASVPANFKVDRTATSTSSDVRKVGTFAAAGTATTQVGGANLS